MTANWSLASGALAYNFVVIILVTLWIKSRLRANKIEEDFILSGRNLPWYVIGVCNALTCIGGGHILGLTGQSWHTGFATMWFSISMCMSFVLIMMYVGPWLKRTGFVTISGMFETLFGPVVRPVITAVAVGACFGIVTLETQGLGAIVTISTGVPMWVGAIIGGTIGLLYVLLAGIKEVAYINLVNAVLMYVAGITALILLGARLPGGWSAVNDFYIARGESHLLTIFGNGDIVRTYVVGTFVSCLFYNPIVQQCAQVSASAKNANHIKKAMLIAIPVNFLYSALMVALGMVSQTLDVAQIIPDGGPAMLLMAANYLPQWLSIVIIGTFLAALMSTFGMLSLASSVHIVKDIAEEYFAKKPFTLKQEGKYTRITLVVFCAVAIAISTFLPAVNPAIVWCFSWATPMFVMFVVGLHFKRSTWACLVTFIVCFVLNMLLTLTPIMAMMNLEGNNHALYMFVVAVVFGYGLTALDKNAKPSFTKEYKRTRALYDAQMAQKSS